MLFYGGEDHLGAASGVSAFAMKVSDTSVQLVKNGAGNFLVLFGDDDGDFGVVKAVHNNINNLAAEENRKTGIQSQFQKRG